MATISNTDICGEPGCGRERLRYGALCWRHKYETPADELAYYRSVYHGGLPEPPQPVEVSSGNMAWWALRHERETAREIREADASTARIARLEDQDYALELELREDAERRALDEQPPDGCGACGETPAYYYAAYPDSGRLCDNHATLEAEGRARAEVWG